MTTTVMNIYQKCLKEKTECSNNTKLSGSDYFGMNNEDHLKRISADITFIPIYIQENNFKMFVVGSSHNKIEPLDEEYQNSDVNEFWKSIGVFNMFTGSQLFLLENIELKQKIDELIIKKFTSIEFNYFCKASSNIHDTL
ncbi:6717_t:CDS:2 [Entrophospora sp. SA101]|nr:6717_t:CDS:2 [Entrophospora sp. SA101]CAJ0874156.1 7659_t:CDS:2 [Entrophospora sp. SA101]CAJ0874376.1 12841_t:CDS:2 [Entrophospora sp. SA101]